MKEKGIPLEDLPFLKWLFQKRHIFLFFISVYIISFIFILIANFPPSMSHFTLEDVAKRSLIADENIPYIDTIETSKKIKDFEAELPYFYRYMENHLSIFQSNLNFLDSLSQSKNDEDFYKELKNRNFLFSHDVFKYFLERRKVFHKLTNRVIYIYLAFTEKYLIVDKLVNERTNLTLIKSSGTEKININSVLFYPVEKQIILEFVKKIFPYISQIESEFYSEILQNLILPTGMLDEAIRENRLNEYLREISMPENYIVKGKIIVKKGEKINTEKFSRISAYLNYKRKNFLNKIIFYFIVSLSLFVFILYRFFSLEKSVFQKLRNIIIASSGFIVANMLFYVSSLFYREYNNIQLFLLIPFGVITSLLPIILPTTGLSVNLLISYTFFSFFYPFFDLLTYFNLLILSFSVIYTSKLLKKRGDFFTLGLLLTLIEFAFVFLYFALLEKNLSTSNIMINILFAAGNGMLCAIFSLGFLPFIEDIFKIPTHFKLLELSNVSTSELLKKFRNEAKGSYNHSIMLGDMCEQAAEAIGVDPLLVKVGAYYHDIGKMFNPEYFIENQSGENKHNEMKISMSVSVIKSHVKLGIDVARKYRIPEEVIDFIREHHGTTTISYFYHQAAGIYGEENLNISDFEYQGPKPKSKAVAILMLADSIEATLRTYSQSAEKINVSIIKDVIDDIVEKRIKQGQLEECNITLNEITLIKQEFLKFLYSYYHKRISYEFK
ncbi:MAG: HDIG domain-containing metalloprotein [Brevinematia bacterium]